MSVRGLWTNQLCITLSARRRVLTNTLLWYQAVASLAAEQVMRRQAPLSAASRYLCIISCSPKGEAACWWRCRSAVWQFPVCDAQDAAAAASRIGIEASCIKQYCGWAVRYNIALSNWNGCSCYVCVSAAYGAKYRPEPSVCVCVGITILYV